MLHDRFYRFRKIVNILTSRFIAGFLMLSATAGCFLTNPAVNGADVVDAESVENRFMIILLIKTFQVPPASNSSGKEANIDFPLPVSFSLVDYWENNRNLYYYTHEADACEKLLLGISVNSVEEVLSQFYYIRYFVCDLEPVNFFNERHPLQGEIRLFK